MGRIEVCLAAANRVDRFLPVKAQCRVAGGPRIVEDAVGYLDTPQFLQPRWQFDGPHERQVPALLDIIIGHVVGPVSAVSGWRRRSRRARGLPCSGIAPVSGT